MPEIIIGPGKLAKTLERISLPAHLCLIYETLAEQFETVGLLVRLGLERGEHCLYLTADNTTESVLAAMRTEGIEVDAALNAGALTILTQPEPLLPDPLNPDRLIDLLAEAIQAAKIAGFATLRVILEIIGRPDQELTVEQFINFEAKLDTFLLEHGILILCQYNRHHFTQEIILNMIRAHPLVIVGGTIYKNSCYLPPQEFGRPEQTALEVDWLLTCLRDHEQLEETLQQRNRDLAVLNRASHVFISTLDLDQVLTVVLEEMRYMLGVLACSAWLVDPATGELVCRQVTNPQSERIRGWRLRPGQGLAGWVAQSGQSLIATDVLTEERHFKGVDEQTGLPLRSILTVPLWARQKVIGILQVVDTNVGRFNQTDLTLLESLAATAAIAIENARLYEQMRQDAETKAALLHEVNHRVKNNLAAIVGLLYAELRHAGLEDQPVYQELMADLVNRVQGLATVHNMLSDSEWAPLLLSDLVNQVIRSSLQALPRDKHMAVIVSPSPVRVTADQAHNLTLIINELTTNTIRHALGQRDLAHLRVDIHSENDLVQLEFQDDGPGYPEEVLRLERHGVGFDLIIPLARKSLCGELSLYNNQGAVTTIRFKPNGEVNKEKDK